MNEIKLLTCIVVSFFCILLAVTLGSATEASTTNCWLIYGGVCIKTGGSGCPFINSWFSWLHCPIGYHCCAPSRQQTVPPIDRHPLVPCGNRTGDRGPVSMVIGGSASRLGDWPWVAQIRKLDGRRMSDDEGQHHCGGALVHPRWVLSAGHCFAFAVPGESFTVHIGHTKSGDSSEQSFNASKIIVHEKFFQPVYSNDVALVQLDRPADLSQLVYPICLPEPGESFGDSVGCVAGWGATSDRKTSSDHLMETQLPTVKNEKCKDLYASINRPIYPENICAGYMAGERDACGGDSGGALMTHRDGRWLAAGLVSHGDGCGRAGKPGVYAGVANYVGWMLAHIGAA